MFTYRHRVQFYETDLMGIIHHSNYLRIYEEARVAWAHDRGLIDYQRPESAAHFAVLETRVLHHLPGKFGDDLSVDVQARRDGIRVFFQYRVRRDKDILSTGETVHVPLNSELKAIRLPQNMRDALEKETWTETWLSNS